MLEVTTLLGRCIDLHCPLPSDFDIEEIAHALAITNRFAGHTRLPFSVAQHSCCVAQLVKPPYKLQALLHDAHEMVTGEIPGPVKIYLGDSINRLQYALDRAVWKAFRVTRTEESNHAVDQADRKMLAIEFRDLRPEGMKWVERYDLPAPDPAYRLNPLTWQQAERMFLETFEEVRN